MCIRDRWKLKSKFCSDSFQAAYLNRSVMRFDNPLYHRKTEPRALPAGGAGGVCLIKTFPDMGQVFLGNTDSVITDRDRDMILRGSHGDHNPAVFPAVADGVGQKVFEQADHHRFVGGDGNVRCKF